MIIMVMSEKNSSDISDVYSSFRDPARHPVASVNDIEGSIDDQQVRGLRPMGSRWRTRRRPERNNPGARLRRSEPRLRARDARHRRERGSARGQMQKSSAGKFHGALPERL